jgi:arsenate reductase-like glutaredoxin family protein
MDVDKLPEIVTFFRWKRVTKQRMRIVQEEASREEFKKLWASEVSEFKEHIHKVQTQYAQSRHLKQHLPDDEVIVHMDFSENYTCKSAEEIQSA